MALSKKKIAKELVAAAFEFHSGRPWERFENQDVVAMRVAAADGDETVFACVMGAGGEEFGLVLYRGEHAVAQLRALFDDDVTDVGAIDETHTLSFSMSPLAEVPPDCRQILDLAGFQGRREAPAPWFVAMEPGRRPRRPNRDEMELLLFALRGFLRAFDDSLVDPEEFAAAPDCPLLVVAGDARSPDVTAERLSLADRSDASPAAPVEIPEGARALPRGDEVWEVAIPVVPTRIRGDDRAVRMLVVLDAATGLLPGTRMTLDVDQAPAELLRVALEPMVGEPRLPREVRFSSRAHHRRFVPVLEELGVAATLSDDLPAVAELVDRFVGEALGGSSRVPADDDLEGWKKADNDLTQHLHDTLGIDRILDLRNLRAFFGSAAADVKTLAGYLDEGAGPAYLEWLLWGQRSGPTGRRNGEEILATGGLEPAHRILVRNRLHGRLSFYRVDEIRDRGRMVLTDVLDGSRHEIVDFSLATTERIAETCVAFHLYRAGDHHFAAPMGPPLAPGAVDEILDHLEEHVSPLTPANLAEHPEALGPLWVRHLTKKDAPVAPLFRNAEGHVMSLREATFTAEDPAAVEAALLRLDGFHDDGDRIAWHHHIEEERSAPADSVVRATLERTDDGFRAVTNSGERMAALREILLALPGVSVEDERDATPPDIRKSQRRSLGTGGPEVVVDTWVAKSADGDPASASARYLREQFLDWIERPIPAFDGRSPREVCATEAGRRRILRRILARPRPPGPDGAAPDLPRDEAIRRLGLEDLLAK